MVEQMRKGPAGDGHAELGAIGEVRERLSAGRMLLSEDQLALRPLGRPPMGDPPLQRAQMAVAIAPRMQPLQLFEQSRGPDLGRGLEHRHEFVAPDLGERIRACPVAPPSRWLGRTGLASMRRPVRSLNPARAAAAAWGYPSLRELM